MRIDDFYKITTADGEIIEGRLILITEDVLVLTEASIAIPGAIDGGAYIDNVQTSVDRSKITKIERIDR